MKTFGLSMKLFCVCAGLFVSVVNASAWGQMGHDVTCGIASKHLTPKAQKKISEILDGKSLVYWANWMDNASHTPEFAYTSTWHYRNIDAGQDYDKAPRHEKGDVLTAIEAQINALNSGTLDKESQALALKMLIHFVGDLHCPMHMGHLSDRGGNQWQVQFFGKGTNLHKIFDSGVIDSAHKWSRTEWIEEIDTITKEEMKEIVAGSPYEWGKGTFALSTAIYDGTPVGSKLSFDYVSKWTPTIERQLLCGGLRLASILNGIFK